jgi:hypothetical protein
MPTIPSNEQFVGIASTQDLTERGSSQTNSARTIYTYADFQSGAQSATAVTGVEVSFQRPYGCSVGNRSEALPLRGFSTDSPCGMGPYGLRYIQHHSP